MTPYETLLSESQERMLVIVKKGQEDSVRQIFEKWDLPYAEIGTVKDDGFMRVKENGVTVVEIPARSLAEKRRSTTARFPRRTCPLRLTRPRCPRRT